MRVCNSYTFSLLVFLFCVNKNKGRPVDIKSDLDNRVAETKLLFTKFSTSSPAKISYSGSYPAGATSCDLDPIPPILSQNKWVLAAVSKDQYFGSLICGTCVKISVIDLTKDEDPEVIFAAIVDICNDCEKGEISLYTDKEAKRKANFQALDCFGTNDGDSALKVVLRSTAQEAIKVQVKNSLLPLAGLELFSDGKWDCLPREFDNHFYIYTRISHGTPMQFRVTSIAGETIGFSINNFTFNEEISLNHQFRPFARVTPDGKEAVISCYGHTNLTSAVPSLETSSPSVRNTDAKMANEADSSKPTRLYDDKFSKSNITNVNQTNSSSNSSTESTEVFDVPLNVSFCEQKADGTYSRNANCKQFVLCSHGVAHGKTCPNDLRFNPKEGVCDWADNVNCGHEWKDYISAANPQSSVEIDDEEIYTRKFMKQKSSNYS